MLHWTLTTTPLWKDIITRILVIKFEKISNSRIYEMIGPQKQLNGSLIIIELSNIYMFLLWKFVHSNLFIFGLRLTKLVFAAVAISLWKAEPIAPLRFIFWIACSVILMGEQVSLSTDGSLNWDLTLTFENCVLKQQCS